MPSLKSNGFMNCSWHDIEHCLQPKESDYQRLNKLGGGEILLSVDARAEKFVVLGTYGDVFRVRHRFTGHIFALKQIRDEHDVNGIPATAMREASILRQLNHPNIIQLEDVFLTDDRCYFLLEYMDEDLKRYLDRNRPLERTIVQVNGVFLVRIDDRLRRVLCTNYLMRSVIAIKIELFIEISNHIIFWSTVTVK